MSLDEQLLKSLKDDAMGKQAFRTSWTTDAPYRETSKAIDIIKESGVDCVEMESAAYKAQVLQPLCLARKFAPVVVLHNFFINCLW